MTGETAFTIVVIGIFVLAVVCIVGWIYAIATGRV